MSRGICLVCVTVVLSAMGCASHRAGLSDHPILPMLGLAAPKPRVATRTVGELRVMSFNIRTKTVLDVVGNRWGSRKDLLIQTVDNFNPDVLGTQECGMDQARD